MIDLRELIQKISQAKDKSELQNIKSQFLGKNSQINQEFKKLGSLSEDERLIPVGSTLNQGDYKTRFQAAINTGNEDNSLVSGGVSQAEIDAALNSGLAPLPPPTPQGLPPGYSSPSPPTLPPGLPPGFPPSE